MIDKKEDIEFYGSKGGSSDPTIAANTLQSSAKARMVEILGEGPIEGLVNGAKSIYFDKTPIINENDVTNFENVTWEEHKGLPSDTAFNGHTMVETPVSVAAEVTISGGPIVKTITETNADAVRVIVKIPSLYQSQSDGGVSATSVSYAIDVRESGGSYVETILNDIQNQKTTSSYQVAHRVELPADGAPWDIRLRRITADSTTDKLQNETWFDSYVILVEGKFIYPNSAAIFMELSAEDMGSSIPSRFYHVKGLKIQVPSNFDPIGRTFAGVWDGTFKNAWTDDPTWIFYDIVTNDRYGLGDYISSTVPDKWSLYAISQYCQEMIPSGYKDSEGADVLEPRFTFNGVINTRQEAYKTLQMITNTWRGMSFWALGSIFAVADMPEDPIKAVSPSNVVGGQFDYSGTGMKARHSVALVSYNDKNDFYEPTVEPVISDSMLENFGWREKTIQLIGCNSRGQAHRFGKWVLDVEENETETVSYSASWDHADVRPGNIIAIADPNKAGVRIGGRLQSATLSYAVIDKPFIPADGETYSIMMMMPDGSMDTKPISSFEDEVIEDEVSVGFTKLNFDAAYTSGTNMPDVNSNWVITGSDVAPRLFRVMNIREEKKNIFAVTALFHDVNKYARVEQDILFDAIPFTRDSTRIQPPDNLSINESNYLVASVPKSVITLSWSPADDLKARRYRVNMVNAEEGSVNLGEVEGQSIDVEILKPGTYSFDVFSIGVSGDISLAANITYSVVGWDGLNSPTVTNLNLTDRGTSSTFVGKDIDISWKNNFPTTTDSGSTGETPSESDSPFYKENTIEIYDAVLGDLLRTQRVVGERFVYTYDMNVADNVTLSREPTRDVRFEVTVTDRLDHTSSAVLKTVSNPIPLVLILNSSLSGNVLNLWWTKPVDEDFSAVKVWVSEVSGFDPLMTTPVHDTPNSNVTIGVNASTIYYARIGAYDAFGSSSINISDEITITVPTGGLTVDDAISIEKLAPEIRELLANTHTRVETLISELEQLGNDTGSTAAHEFLERKDLFAVAADNTALIIEEQLVRATADSALASDVTVVQASVDNVSASGLFKMESIVAPSGVDVRLSLRARVDSGESYEDSGIVIDVYETAPSSGVYTSRVLVQAEKFLVIDGSENLLAMFSVDGILLPGRIPEITAGMIAADAVTADKIDAGVITTNHIAINGLTGQTTVTATDSDSIASSGSSWVNVAGMSATISVAANTKVLILANATFGRGGGWSPDVKNYMRVQMDGVSLVSDDHFVRSGGDDASYETVAYAAVIEPSVASHTFNMQWQNTQPASGSGSIKARQLIVIQYLR